MIELLDAMLFELRSGAKAFSSPTLDANNSRIEPEGKPPPSAPDFYLSLDEGSCQETGSGQAELNEVFGVTAYLSLRVAELPRDRFDELYRRTEKGLAKLEVQVKRALHLQWAVITKANEYLLAANSGNPVANLLLPLKYSGRGRTLVRGAEWSNEHLGAGDDPPPFGWVVRELPFVGARRIQYASSIT